MIYLLNHQPITWSTFSSSIWSKLVLFHTYSELGYLATNSWSRFLPSSLSPVFEYSGSVSLLGINFRRPPAKITSMPSPYGNSTSCKAVTRRKKSTKHEVWCTLYSLKSRVLHFSPRREYLRKLRLGICCKGSYNLTLKLRMKQTQIDALFKNQNFNDTLSKGKTKSKNGMNY